VLADSKEDVLERGPEIVAAIENYVPTRRTSISRTSPVRRGRARPTRVADRPSAAAGLKPRLVRPLQTRLVKHAEPNQGFWAKGRKQAETLRFLFVSRNPHSKETTSTLPNELRIRVARKPRHNPGLD
jgi:hypothetical protein